MLDIGGELDGVAMLLWLAVVVADRCCLQESLADTQMLCVAKLERLRSPSEWAACRKTEFRQPDIQCHMAHDAGQGPPAARTNQKQRSDVAVGPMALKA